MVEFLVFAVIAIGLIRRRGEHWEFSRRRVGAAVDQISVAGEGAVQRVKRTVPELFAQCFVDVRTLLEDVAGLLHPRARRRIEDGARGVLARRSSRRLRQTGHLGALPAGAGMPTEHQPTGGRAQRAYATLQRRYLEGSISLDQYVDEAGRLRTDEPTG